MRLGLSKASQLGGNCPLCDAGIQIDSSPAVVTGTATMSAVMVRASYLFAGED